MASVSNPSDFYIACATVIPVLFLALAVQGRTYADLMRAADPFRSGALARPGGKGAPTPKGQWRVTLVPLISAVAGGMVLVSGGVGESFAIWALYSRSDTREIRLFVLLMTLVLVAVVVFVAMVAAASSPGERKTDERRDGQAEAGNGPGA